MLCLAVSAQADLARSEVAGITSFAHTSLICPLNDALTSTCATFLYIGEAAGHRMAWGWSPGDTAVDVAFSTGSTSIYRFSASGAEPEMSKFSHIILEQQPTTLVLLGLGLGIIQIQTLSRRGNG